MTVADLSERELVARIQRRLAPAPDWLLVGIGDDAAVVEPARNRVEVLTVDVIVEGVHFDRAFVPPEAIGHRALAVNLSDLAAMGAAPRLALLSMALPPALSVADFDAVADGVAALAARHRLHVVGGNLTRSPGPLMIDMTVAGTVKRRQALTRSGARPGDDLYVSGSIGGAAAGLAMLRQRPRPATVEDSERAQEECRLDRDLTSVSSASAAVERYLRPEPRVLLGVHLGRNRAASACMDLSDGLADGAHGIAEASDVGIAIDAAALPIDPDARAWFDARGQDAIVEALTAGDDYELLFTVRPRTRRRLLEAARRGGVPLTRIGRCTADRAVVLQRPRDGSIDVSPLPQGFTHFARLKGSRSV
jgi:thiamine-monophosphate kinase